jgi:transformation/transcription domain-associated protein
MRITLSLHYQQYTNSNHTHSMHPPHHPTPKRRIAFVGSDGRTRHFLLQTGQNTSQGHADDRLLQLMRLCNALLERRPDSRKRALAWHTPAIVPVWPQLRLIEEEPSYTSYYEAYEVGLIGLIS